MKFVSIGEILWDVVGASEHLGGAPFNMAAHLFRLGHDARFVSAIGDDHRGRLALDRVQELGLNPSFIETIPGVMTGAVSVTLDAAGQPDFRICRPAAYDFVELSALALARLKDWQPDWICYGTLFQSNPQARAAILRILEACPSATRFYDVNLRKPWCSPELVVSLLSMSTAVKLNHGELAQICQMTHVSYDGVENACRFLRGRFGWYAMCVTHGEDGCSILRGDEYVEAPGYRIQVADTVGAGDAFAAGFLHGIGAGWPLEKIGDFANRLGAMVAARHGAIPNWTEADWDGSTKCHPQGNQLCLIRS